MLGRTEFMNRWKSQMPSIKELRWLISSNAGCGPTLIDLADKKPVLKFAASERHLELVLGDAHCNYRTTIERVK